MKTLPSLSTKYQPAIFSLGLALLVLMVPNNLVFASVGAVVQGLLLTVVNVVFGWMVWVGGMLLDYAINTMVVGFGDLYTRLGLGFTIDRLWVMIRDIFNLTFIFGLIFIGLKMIFDSSNSDTRRALISLIIAALLVNFSLLITKFVVDFSNIAAEQIVQTFPTNAQGQAQISASFMAIMGLNSLWDLGGNIEKFEQFRGASGLGYIFGTMFLYIIAAFVFISGALLLIIRFAALNLYMLFSPIMFLGMVFPSLANISQQYWRGFLSRAFVAPVYILMLYFAHEILRNFAITGGSGSMSDLFGPSGPTSFAQVMPPFILTAIFLIAAVVIAQKLSDEGVGAVTNLQNKMIDKVRGGVQKTAFAPARAGARVVGTGTRRAVNYLGAKSHKEFEKWQAAGQRPGASRKVRAASWVLSRNTVDRKARAAAKAMEEAQFGTGTTNKAEEEYRHNVQAGINRQLTKEDRTKTLNETTKALNGMEGSATELEQALKDLGKTIRNLSKEEKSDLKYEQLTNKHIAYNLSDADIKDFESSGKFNRNQIENIKNVRKEAQITVAKHGSTLTKKEVLDKDHPTITTEVPAHASITHQRNEMFVRNQKDANDLPLEVFKEPAMAEHITPQALEERLRSPGSISNEDHLLIKKNLEIYINDPYADPKKVAAWKKWKESTTYGAGFGLVILPWDDK